MLCGRNKETWNPSTAPSIIFRSDVEARLDPCPSGRSHFKSISLKKRGNDHYRWEQGPLWRVFLCNAIAVKTPCKGLGSASLSASAGHHLLIRPSDNTFPSGQTCLGICQVPEAEGVSGFCLGAAETNEEGSQEHS